MPLIGLLLSLLLAGLYALGLRAIVRVPFRALGVLVGGMAFHNFILMILLRLGTPRIVVRLIQSWKEGILLLLIGLAAAAALRAWRAGRMPRLKSVDILLIAFTLVVLIYFVLPPSVFGVHTNLSQRLVGLRIALLLPLLYLFGRLFWSSQQQDVRWVAVAIVGSAAVVGLFGLVELWLVPTVRWIDWGVNDLSAWLGFHYHGPGGLPENFFQTTSQGLLLRRMVSTYVSPLGIAYTSLLVIPLGLSVQPAWRGGGWTRRAWLTGLLLTLAGLTFSITRLALVLAVIEVALLAVLLRRRQLVVATAVIAACAAFALYLYPNVGPLVDRSLIAVGHRHAGVITSRRDPSLNEHLGQLGFDLQYVLQHPLGTGVGTSVHRFGPSAGTGESAILDITAETGAVGGLLYLFSYGLLLLLGFQAFRLAHREPWQAVLPLVCLVGGLALIPVTLTSDLWGDFSVTFLFWWAAGYGVTLVARQRVAAR